MEPEIVDRIYESAFLPEQWPDALEIIRGRTNAVGVSLMVGRGDDIRCTASPGAQSFTEKFVREGWFSRGRVVKRMFAERGTGFIRDLDFFEESELEDDPVYRDLWRPKLKVGWALGIAIPLPTEDWISVVATRRIVDGPFSVETRDDIDGVRPHLARAALLSARLQLDRARAAAETLTLLGLPAFVIDRQAKVLVANELTETLSGAVRWRAFDRFVLRDSNADRLLREALAALDAPGEPSPRSFPAHDVEADVTRVAHVIPIRRAARDIFVRSTAVVALTPTTAPKAPPIDLVRSLFDLTPAEARAACGLAEGKSIEHMAKESGVSTNTLRTHVKMVLVKTGLHRQGEVTALLNGLSPIRQHRATDSDGRE